jgi:hypothetical protein
MHFRAVLHPAYLRTKLTRPLPTKDGGVRSIKIGRVVKKDARHALIDTGNPLMDAGCGCGVP